MAVRRSVARSPCPSNAFYQIKPILIDDFFCICDVSWGLVDHVTLVTPTARLGAKLTFISAFDYVFKCGASTRRTLAVVTKIAQCRVNIQEAFFSSQKACQVDRIHEPRRTHATQQATTESGAFDHLLINEKNTKRACSNRRRASSNSRIATMSLRPYRASAHLYSSVDRLRWKT